jgi:hypothetical protein
MSARDAARGKGPREASLRLSPGIPLGFGMALPEAAIDDN